MRVLFLVLILVLLGRPAPAVAQEPHPCETIASPELAQMLLDTRSDPNDFTEYDPDGDGIACEPDELAAIDEGAVEAGTEAPFAPLGATCDLAALTHADPAEAPTLDGRVGGTVASFTTIYGEPTGSGPFPEYHIPGCGPTLISDYEGSIVVEVMVFSPRSDSEKDFNEPDEADWTVSEAMTIAESFLPTDTVFEPPMGDVNPPEPGMLADEIEVRCSSQTLLTQVPAAAYEYVDNTPTYGGCSYWLLRTTSGNVSHMVIELRIED